ncbi:MAG TPA: hypothetical protein VGI69_11985 [Gaiellaceae bacterium]|jgi:hypothetical protein
MPAASEGHYWSLDVPGLTGAEARQIVEWVEANSAGWFGKASPLDPREWLTLHLDRESAKTLHVALTGIDEPNGSGQGLTEAIREWLQWSAADSTARGS